MTSFDHFLPMGCAAWVCAAGHSAVHPRVDARARAGAGAGAVLLLLLQLESLTHAMKRLARQNRTPGGRRAGRTPFFDATWMSRRKMPAYFPVAGEVWTQFALSLVTFFVR